MKKLLVSALGLFASLGLVACGPDYQRTDIPQTSVIASSGADINYQHVTVPQGMILKVHIVSFNTDGKTMNNQVRSNDASIMDATGVVSDHDYAFLGIKTGKTTIEIKAEDEVVLILDAFVTEQPAPPQ